MRGRLPGRAQDLAADEAQGSGFTATCWARKKKMGWVGLEGKLLQRVNHALRSEQIVKQNGPVLLKPDGHEPKGWTMVLELCERNSSLGAEALRAVAAEFHENTGTASLAADTVALSVERFEVSAIGALVVDEFNHGSLSNPRDRGSCFQPFSVEFV